MLSTNDQFPTSDLDIASYLLCEGHCTLQNIQERGHKRYFILAPRPNPSVINNFVNNQVTIHLAAFLDARRKLITAMQVCVGKCEGFPDVEANLEGK